ncbi:MAG: FkbM family methyltransferase [Rhodospirillales bacterium]|nr:FkbM family methyltransferase [Rhodospirillales bacterium]
MTAPTKPSLNEILKTNVMIDVVDIGSNPIDAKPPYAGLLKAGLARVTGFEPNPDALAQLNAKKGDLETYLPYAVADGKTHEFKVCQASGMSSLLEPNQDLLQYYHGFPEWGKVLSRQPIDTVRLDDVEEIGNLDFLKIDIQGGELCAFENATERLAECVVIHTEVEFLPMYVDQPLFSEVEMFLRGLGFRFHRFVPLVSRIIQPMLIDDNIYQDFSQVFWADAVFVRDFTRLTELEPGKLLKLACVLHDVYGSGDLVVRALMAHDALAGSGYAVLYLQTLGGQGPQQP